MTDAATPTPLDKSIERDGVLQFLAKLTELGVSTPITISAGGAIVTGQLISAKEYFREMGGLWENSWPGDGAQTMGELWASFGQGDSDDQGDTDKPFNFEDIEEYRYIHLRDAQFVMGHMLAPGNGSLWRIRIASVAGFSFGKVSS